MAAVSSAVPSPAYQPHLLAIPLPAQGHITPLMRVCKILASHGFLITFVNIDTVHDRISQFLQQEHQQNPSLDDLDPQSLLPRIRRVHVPIGGLDMTNGFRLSIEHFLIAVESIAPALNQLVDKLSKDGHPVTCLLSDVWMSSVSQKVADKFHVPVFALFTSSQRCNLFNYYVSCGVIDVDNAIEAARRRGKHPDDLFHEALPGLPAFRIAEVPSCKHLFDENEFFYQYMVRQYKIAYDKAHAIVVNSFEELEVPSFEAMRNLIHLHIYSLGPLVEELTGGNCTSLWTEEAECLDWLEDQAPQSVLYVSFGSVTLLSKVQFEDILAGLEASNQKFLLAFRPDLVEEAAYSSIPAEYLKRTKDRGYVVRWAPQQRVLSHPSVGGFLTHCGWNSTMEGVASGVPMLCWPYFGDQFMDARCIVEEWEIGLRFEAGEDGLVSKNEVEKKVKALIKGEEGKLLRRNSEKLKEAGRRSLKEGGSSYKNVKVLVEALSSHHQSNCDKGFP